MRWRKGHTRRWGSLNVRNKEAWNKPTHQCERQYYKDQVQDPQATNRRAKELVELLDQGSIIETPLVGGGEPSLRGPEAVPAPAAASGSRYVVGEVLEAAWSWHWAALWGPIPHLQLR